MDEGLLNDLLECSVCLERLDTSSRVLPCQHTFCLKCLKVIVESHKELRCPECRVVVEARVDELPPNVLLMRILEGMRNSTPRKPLNSARLRATHSQAQTQQGVPRGDAKQLPPHARAMHDFISKEPGDLSFKKGDTILLQKKLDSYWYQGENSGRIGIFPITYVQVVVPLPVPTALCKALYDFRMSAPDEEGCLAFDKGAIITVHRRVDENWAEGRLDQRVGIFPIAFVELNQPARQLMNSIPLNRPVPPLPDHARPGHSEHRHHAQQSHRYQPMSMSAPSSGPAYQNMAPMTHSHPAYSSPQPAYSPPQPAYSPPQPAYSPPLQTPQPPQPPHNPRIMEASHKHSLDLIHFTNVHTKHQTMVQSAPRIGDSYDRLRLVKYDYNSTPVHKVETTYQNVRDFPVTVANFTNVSSDSSSSMNTPSVVSSTTTPNTSSDTSTCESAEPSLPGSPDTRAPTGNDARVSTGNDTRVSTGNDARISTGNDARCPPVNDTQGETVDDTSMGVLTLNESSTATNTSLNVTLPESPKSNAPPANTTSQSNSENDEGTSNNDPSRLEAASSKNVVLRGGGGESLLNFGLGLQAALSASGDHREKRHSLTPTTHLQGNHAPQNRHSAEIVATSLLDGRRRARSHERPLPAAYVALYAYRPQKPDELELRKGGVYTVTERCRDGWFKGWSERSQRSGVFPGNYVAPTSSSRSKHEKSAPASSSARSSGGQCAVPAGTAGPASAPGPAGPTGPAGSPAVAPPDAPPRANSPTTTNAQPLLYTWNTSAGQSQQSTPRSEKSKDKSKAEKSSISGVSLMKRLAAMKKCKSPPPAYSMDNPVFEDAPSSSLMQVTHPVHVRSGSCPSQLLRTLPGAAGGPGVPGVPGGQGGPGGPAGSERLRHKERPSVMPLHEHHAHRSGTEGPWMSQHRKSQSLDVTATRRDRHHSQPVKERFRCIVPYPPNSEYELELKVDDIVLVSKKRGDGWYKGTLQRTGRSGLFPASFVQSCPPH